MNLDRVPTGHVSLVGHAHEPGADPVAGWLPSHRIGGQLSRPTLVQ
jgi:hypothetical protein